MQEFKPFAEMDNGALLTAFKSWAEGVRDDAWPGSNEETKAETMLAALDVLEGRKSFQSVMNEKE